MNRKILKRILTLLCLNLLLTACTNKSETETEPTVLETILLETKYVTIQYPKQFEDVLRHQEVVQDDVAMEIFSMTGEHGDRELFRVYFNDSSIGSVMGYLTKGADQIPVSYSVCEYEGADFPNEKTKEEYHSIMDSFDVVMDTICENPQFREERWMEPVGNQVVNLTYWKAELPKNVFWEERETNDIYRVVFYGIIQDERVDLYAVGLGEMDADYSVGYFTTDGVTRPVQVRIFDLPQENNWPEENYDIAYRMMESVNAVIDAVVVHENFSESEPAR